MTIEQAFMGRGLTDSVIAKWILSMIILIAVTKSIGDFFNVNYSTLKQHIDARSSRISKDNSDLKRLTEFLKIHDPFKKADFILSISSDWKGDDSIKCFNALEEDTLLLKRIIGQNFGDVKFQRKNKVLPLSAISSTVKVGDDILTIDPTLLFQRISLQ